MLYISADTPVYMPLIRPKDVGFRLWSQLDVSGLVLDAPPIGKHILFEEHDKFRAIYEGFVEGKEWDQTSRYLSALREIKGGGTRWRCRTEEQLRRRFYVDLPKLYESIRTHGILTQEELLNIEKSSENSIPLSSRISIGHEIKLGINEEGDFLFLDGAHRLGISKLLKLDRIPVRIMFVHAQIGEETLRARIGELAQQFRLPQNGVGSTFERLGGIEATPGTVTAGERPARTLRRRNLLVASSLNVTGMRVLDVGCAEGLTSLYLSKDAEEVVGVDHSSRMIRIAKASAKTLNCQNVSFLQEDVRNEKLFEQLGRFDLIIAWGFLHRITDPFELLYRLANLADTLSLEWRTPVFPNMSEISVASHPPRGNRLDPMNIRPFDPSDEDAPASKVEGATAFWEMTPGAVKVILRRLGFTDFRVLGYGEKLRSEARVVQQKFDPKWFSVSGGLRNERVHMIASRSALDDWIKDGFPRQFRLPKWDFSAREYVFRKG